MASEARVFDGDAECVELPTLDGQIGVYPGPVRLMAGLEAGEIRIHAGATSFAVAGGHVEIEPSLISALTLFASPEAEKVKIEESCDRAREALEMADSQPQQIDDNLARLRIELARWKKGMKPRTGERK